MFPIFTANFFMLTDIEIAQQAQLKRIEAIVHPLVRARQATFLADAARHAELAVLDIPLLFETGGDKAVDLTVVVSVPEADQRARVMARPGMTESQFQSILSKQMPDDQKRALADVVIPTASVEEARAAVQQLIRTLRKASG